MKLFSVLILLALNGCVMVATYSGAAPATISAAQTADAIKLGIDTVSATKTGKTTTDHAVGIISGRDCKSINVIEGKSYCE